MSHYAHHMTPMENAIIWGVISVFFVAILCFVMADCASPKITKDERQQVLFRECTDGPYFLPHKSIACEKLSKKIVKYMDGENHE